MTSSANPVVSFTEPVVTDSDSISTNNDIIANSQPLNLSTDNPQVLVEAEFAQRFEDRSNTADATEDVDMFSVELQAGDRISIDADSVLYEFEGFSTGTGPDIRVFNAAGEPVVVGVDEDGEDIFAESRQDPAPDEAFIAGRDGYLEFTASETGTYYIGASHYRNSFYDPNQVGSGSGAIFSPQFGIGPGPYTLEVELNPEGFDGEVFEEFTGETPADAPVVSFAAVPGTFGRGEDNNDLAVSNELIESEPSTVGILDFTFNVAGEIPAGGLEVFVTSDTDFSTYFEGLQANPRVAVGGEITGGLYDAEGSLIGFKARLDANNARFPYNASDRTDDPEEPETLTFSLTNSSDYIVSETTAVSEVTFYDNLAQVQAEGGPVPEVGISIDNTQLIESEGTETTVTVDVEGEIPEGGLLVYIDGEEGVLGDFDVFNAEITGGTFPAPNANASGFFFQVLENTATISLQVFDETTNNQISPEDATEGVEEFSLSVQPNTAYTIAPNASTIEFTILDNPDSVPLPDDGNGGGNGGTDDPVTDNDGRVSFDDIIANAVATGLSTENPSVAVEGSIDVRWRGNTENLVDNTEDVDIFSFELATGETITIESESVPFELNGITQETTPTLRLFDETGVELALSDTDLEFTATEAGTYYIGVSQYLNDNYDPNVNASGDGVQLIEDGISPGPYTLDIALADNSFEIIGTPDADEIVGDDADNSIDGLSGDDLIAGLLGGDTIVGGDGDDVLRGDANSRASSTGVGGDDVIFGGAGNDRIGGKDGNDFLSGDEGDDNIFGDDGDDTIMGVTGNDILTGDDNSGGSGSDLFVFGNGDGTDTITDFDVTEDLIGLVEGELTFDGLEIIEIDGNAAINVTETGETLAVLNGVGSDELTPEMFVVTPDVSSLDDLV